MLISQGKKPNCSVHFGTPVLSKRRSNVLSKLYKCFLFQDKKELQRLSSVHSNFRKFYLSLAASNSLRVDYLRDDYQEEYGPQFHSSLTRLTNKFLSKIQEHLPLTMLEKVGFFFCVCYYSESTFTVFGCVEYTLFFILRHNFEEGMCIIQPNMFMYNSIQHYVIKFVSDLQQVCGFLWVLWFPPPIKLTTTI